MRARSLVLSITSVVMVALLLAAPVAAAPGDIPFTGHAVTTEYDWLAMGEWTYLPSGRIVITGGSMGTHLYADQVDPAHDYFTGYWIWDWTMVIEPSGAAHAWGTGRSQDLAIFPGEDTGGFVGEFRCQYSPDIEFGVVFRSTVQFCTAPGWGDLEGWTVDFRAFAHQSSVVSYKGEFRPPQ